MGPPRLNGALLIWPTEKVAEAITPLSLKVIILEAVSHKRRRQRAQRGCEEGMKVHCESAAIEHTARPDKAAMFGARSTAAVQTGASGSSRAARVRHGPSRPARNATTANGSVAPRCCFEALQRRCCEKSETVWSGHGRLRR